MADEADDADANSPDFSGTEDVMAMVMVRVRARPSFVKAISIPILRRKVAARRSRPDSARGLSGQSFDLAMRSLQPVEAETSRLPGLHRPLGLGQPAVRLGLLHGERLLHA